MSSIMFEGLVVVLLIFINGIFAMSEIAVVSSRKTRLQQWAEEGNARARAALELASNPNQFLATIQIGITLVGILAGAFGGATIARELAVMLSDITWLQPYGHPLSLVLVVLVITYLSLIVGELVPKRLALNNPERLAMASHTLDRPRIRFSRTPNIAVTAAKATIQANDSSTSCAGVVPRASTKPQAGPPRARPPRATPR